MSTGIRCGQPVGLPPTYHGSTAHHPMNQHAFYLHQSDTGSQHSSSGESSSTSPSVTQFSRANHNTNTAPTTITVPTRDTFTSIGCWSNDDMVDTVAFRTPKRSQPQQQRKLSGIYGRVCKHCV